MFEPNVRPSFGTRGLFLVVRIECDPVVIARSLVCWAPMIWDHSQNIQIVEPHQPRVASYTYTN